jgi:hypothetical protein
LSFMQEEYHHTGIANATPFRDFTIWGNPAHNPGMGGKTKDDPVHIARRDKLVGYIRANFPSETNPKGNVSAFAEAIGKKQSQIADVIDGRKPFGEKLAQGLEKLVSEKLSISPWNKPELRFDVGREAIQTFYGIPLSREAVEFAADWQRMRGPMKPVVRHLVQTATKDAKPKARDARKPSSADVRERLHGRKGP